MHVHISFAVHVVDNNINTVTSNDNISTEDIIISPDIQTQEEQVYIEKKTSLYLLCDHYVLSIADGTSVSTFKCTRKLVLEEVSVSLIAV